MKFRTKLIITFLIVILLPIFLSGVAFVAVGAMVLHNSDMNFQIEISDDSTLSDSLVSLSNTTNNLYIRLGNIAEKDAQKLEDRDFLEEVNGDALQVSSYIVVRKGTEEYYSGSEEMSRRFFSRLPAYGFENQDSYSGFYYNDAQKLVKQIDFVFSDGDEGSLFLVTRVNSVVSKSFLIYLFSAIVFILVLTSIVLTQWVYKGFFEPINRLNVAMQQIAEGNFEYSLTSEDTNEIGELYRNYEDMRLRLKESTEEKIQNERQNRELVSNISHDLKTPITAIKGYVEGIMDGVADTPEKMDRYIKTIYTKANDMNRLINELTYYSGIDSNRIPYNFHRINLAEFFQDCVEDVGLDLESKNIELNYSNLVDPDTRIIADPEQLKKVIDNIVGNSIKYMDKPKGVINIRILDEVDSVRVEIEDNGKGISSRDLGKIFERFYRTDTSRNSSTGGSGIGLSIVKKIIEDHGGYIWATSREGEGTCLHFVIRKYREAEENE
ncbi:MAG TPA: HAMP domain-containing histidine kinase [Candidatus Eisenbergiella merdavium]|uniref:histidine kinase n=1 Tax=Candidatus Eisenbergiella merdavium TaxID=2838551 RepID=A0A9D2SQK3_9FIRM|nr:HAMP domain-containing histidine kinase [Candidatus Eisenbergiella merdavium]